MKQLFEAERFQEALELTFQENDYSYNMETIMIFCFVFFLIFVSSALMCKFMNSKKLD